MNARSSRSKVDQVLTAPLDMYAKKGKNKAPAAPTVKPEKPEKKAKFEVRHPLNTKEATGTHNTPCGRLLRSQKALAKTLLVQDVASMDQFDNELDEFAWFVPADDEQQDLYHGSFYIWDDENNRWLNKRFAFAKALGIGKYSLTKVEANPDYEIIPEAQWNEPRFNALPRPGESNPRA